MVQRLKMMKNDVGEFVETADYHGCIKKRLTVGEFVKTAYFRGCMRGNLSPFTGQPMMVKSSKKLSKDVDSWNKKEMQWLKRKD